MKTWSMYHNARQLLLVVSAVNNLVLHSYKISQVFTKIVVDHLTFHFYKEIMHYFPFEAKQISLLWHFSNVINIFVVMYTLHCLFKTPLC
jgi:hypothetical protein